MSKPTPKREWKMPTQEAVDMPPLPVRTRDDVSPLEKEYLSSRPKDLGMPNTPQLMDYEEPHSPNRISTPDLAKRDRMAIEYARSRLTEGDTLVVVNYPTDRPVCDATGFILDTTFRVHSYKLLATGSRVFTKMLSPESQQKYHQKPVFKTLHIPKDVEYVLDLTPAKDDDDAIELVTSLSCPKGILYWSTSGSRLGIPQKFVGGEDERVGRQREQPLQPLYSPGPTIVNDQNSGSPDSGFPDSGSKNFVDYGAQLREATKRSLKDMEAKNIAAEPNVAFQTSTKQLPADYCGIRHCAGIERLLQLIEGKVPRLDSAPKVWTVAMLANFFDCTNAVVDAVCTWVYSQSNGIIIEILPEDCLRLGLALQSELITRAAFAVLVSEEALCVGGQQDNVPLVRSPRTSLGRLRSDLDDDTLNMVQHAGRSFFDRIDARTEPLLNQQMLWFTTLPEYRKLCSFQQQLISDDPEKTGIQDLALTAIKELQSGLKSYVRGRLFYCLLLQLKPEQIEVAEKHRKSEQYLPSADISVRDAYDSLASKQRVVTRQFWEMVRGCGWTCNHANSNLIYQDLEYTNPHSFTKTNLEVAKYFKIDKVYMVDLVQSRDCVNLALFDYNTKNDPLPEDKPNFTLANLDEPEFFEDPTSLKARNRKIVSWADKFELDLKLGREPSSNYHLAHTYKRIKTGFAAPPDSQLFDLYRFMEEVREYIIQTCDAMLDRGENRSFTIPETLMCLTDAEYKYLPLFAGGLEDGSGGVYQDELPPAEAGPSGPGPSYHTGFSIASAASSTADWDEVSRGARTESTIDGWSRDVDDGVTDHIDRRRVESEVSFGSFAFEELGVGKGKGLAMSEDSFSEMDFEEGEEYVGKGKRKEVEQTVGTSQPSGIDSLMSDDFFNEGDEGDFESGEEDFEFMDDSGDDTATEKGDDDDEDQL